MRLRDQSGFTLTEVLVGATVMIVILGATLAAFASFEDTTRVNQLQNDAQEGVRSSLDQLARELRNHGSATRELPEGIEKADAYDVVFQTVGAVKPGGSENSRNAGRVRYCLDDPEAGAGRLWTQTQTWTGSTPPAVPSTTSCPDSAWGNQRVAATNVTNRLGDRDRAAFCAEVPNVDGCSTDPGLLQDITRLRATLYVDVNPGKKPTESKLETGIQLRNKNRAPQAVFNVALGPSRQVLLNGSDSFDPENDRLTYVWFDGGSEIGRGITFNYQAPASGTRVIELEVLDPAGLASRAQQEVTVP
jgi:type II secretory pathway pseudopilin PulG